jgi:coenzyme F420-reducing hydrogenase delta subunit
MFGTTREITDIMGIDPRRLRLEWISSAEGGRFAEVAKEFVADLKQLGPAKLGLPAYEKSA